MIFTVVNTDRNEELLKAVPHRRICEGMALVYRYYEECRFTNVVTNVTAFEMGLTESQLYEVAISNLTHFLPVIEEEENGVYTISSLNKDLLGPSLAMVPGVLDRILMKAGEESMYVVVNTDKVMMTADISKFFKRSAEEVANRVSRLMVYNREEGLCAL